MALYQVGWEVVGNKIKIIGIMRCGGIDLRPEAQRSNGPIPAFVFSDRERLFGRICPQCKTYFRTDNPTEGHFCPYCIYEGHPLNFQTANQLKFIEMFCRAFIEAYRGPDNVVIDLSQIVKGLPENRPQWVYSEQRQQTRFQCQDCQTHFDVLGEYVRCHGCGKPTWREVIERKLISAENQFNEADNLTDRQARETEWEQILSRFVSDFEAMARELQKLLASWPATPKRRGELHNLSFQNIVHATQSLKDWFGIELFRSISEDDQRFLNLMFNRRHLIVHNAGRVDQEYLNKTGDTTVKLNEKIRIRSKHIRRLLPLVRTLATNLIKDFDSMFEITNDVPKSH
jgi:DNA-directed RNA polymerase subunit RPC12/RpoP